MKKTHFYMSYFGNKRNEVDKIYNHLDLTNIDIVIEPFCGSCALSYYIWTKNPNLKFVLNDTCPYLVQMYHILKNEEEIDKFEKEYYRIVSSFNNDKKKYNEYLKIYKETLMGWFISRKVHGGRMGMFPTNRKCKETIELRKFPIYKFFNNANILYTNEDGEECYKKYKDRDKCLILLDPPYLYSCNNYYNNKTNIYEMLCNNNIVYEKARIYLVLEDTWIIRLLFKSNKILESYDKKYEYTKRTTKHIVIKQ